MQEAQKALADEHGIDDINSDRDGEDGDGLDDLNGAIIVEGRVTNPFAIQPFDLSQFSNNFDNFNGPTFDVTNLAFDPNNQEETLSEGQKEIVVNGLQSIIDGIQQDVEQIGDFELRLPSGTVVSAVEFINTFSSAITILQAGEIVVNGLNGEPVIQDTAALLIGIGIGAAIPASVGVLGVIAISFLGAVATDFVLENHAEIAGPIVEETNELISEFKASAAQQADDFLRSIPNDPNLGPQLNELNFLRNLFNLPTNPFL